MTTTKTCTARTAQGWPCTRPATTIVTTAVGGGRSRASHYRCTQHAAQVTGQDVRHYPLKEARS